MASRPTNWWGLLNLITGGAVAPPGIKLSCVFAQPRASIRGLGLCPSTGAARGRDLGLGWFIYHEPRYLADRLDDILDNMDFFQLGVLAFFTCLGGALRDF